MLGKLVSKTFCTLAGPWRFESYENNDLAPLVQKMETTIPKYEEGFIGSYSAILEAIESADLSLLSEVCDWKLYRSLESLIKSAKSRDYKIKIFNNNDPIQVQYFNGVMGIGFPINDMIASKINDIFDSPNLKFLSGGSSISFSVQAQFTSKKKLVVFDKEGKLIFGHDNEAPESHLFHFKYFEKFSNDLVMFWDVIKRFNRMHLEQNEDANCIWRLHDIDMHFAE